ncbi:MAG: hypothetical protein JEZ01_15120 [Labilibaculum sp.]|nr:hypothetical protein [Labilibaculum sp.]MBI9059093.1 hypothetical protein [Labilibaculum sp.]
MKRNDFVSAMFEEIKESLALIQEKMEANKPTEKEAQKMIPRQLLEFIYQSIQQKFSLSDQSISRQFKELTQETQELKQKITELNEQNKKRKLMFRKLVVWQSIAAVLLLLTIGLFLNNRRLRDNDLKFKYIQYQAGINANGLLKLDTIFHVNRDEKVIERIQDAVKK